MKMDLKRQDINVISREGKCNPGRAIRLLYANALKRLKQLLECHLDAVKDAADTYIQLGLHEIEGHERPSDVKSIRGDIQSAESISKLLSRMSVESAWDNTCVLQQAVDAIPTLAIEKEVAEAILSYYNFHLDIYKRATQVKDYLAEKEESQSEDEGKGIVADRKLVPVELTSSKSLAEFTCQDCHDLLARILSQAYGISIEEIICLDAVDRQSTTVIFLVPNGFISVIMQRTTQLETVWILLELDIIEVAISGFIFNPSVGCFLALLRGSKSFTADLLKVTEVRL